MKPDAAFMRMGQPVPNAPDTEGLARIPKGNPVAQVDIRGSEARWAF